MLITGAGLQDTFGRGSRKHKPTNQMLLQHQPQVGVSRFCQGARHSASFSSRMFGQPASHPLTPSSSTTRKAASAPGAVPEALRRLLLVCPHSHIRGRLYYGPPILQTRIPRLRGVTEPAQDHMTSITEGRTSTLAD